MMKRYEVVDRTFYLIDEALQISIQEPWPFKEEEGKSLEYHPSGVVKSRCFYLGGKLHGPSTFYSKEGICLSSTWFYHGKQMGKGQQFYKSGALYANLPYKDGALEGTCEYFYEDGAVKSLLPYKQGVLHGTALLFHPGGKRKREVTYKEGKKHGKEQIISANGVMIDEGVYEEGAPVGMHTRRYETGKIKEEENHFSDGKVERSCWNDKGEMIYEGTFIDEKTFRETVFSCKEKTVREGEWDGERVQWS